MCIVQVYIIVYDIMHKLICNNFMSIWMLCSIYFYCFLTCNCTCIVSFMYMYVYTCLASKVPRVEGDTPQLLTALLGTI